MNFPVELYSHIFEQCDASTLSSISQIRNQIILDELETFCRTQYYRRYGQPLKRRHATWTNAYIERYRFSCVFCWKRTYHQSVLKPGMIICRSCEKKSPRFDVIMKTRAKRDYLFDEGDFPMSREKAERIAYEKHGSKIEFQLAWMDLNLRKTNRSLRRIRLQQNRAEDLAYVLSANHIGMDCYYRTYIKNPGGVDLVAAIKYDKRRHILKYHTNYKDVIRAETFVCNEMEQVALSDLYECELLYAGDGGDFEVCLECGERLYFDKLIDGDVLWHSRHSRNKWNYPILITYPRGSTSYSAAVAKAREDIERDQASEQRRLDLLKLSSDDLTWCQ